MNNLEELNTNYLNKVVFDCLQSHKKNGFVEELHKRGVISAQFEI